MSIATHEFDLSIIPGDVPPTLNISQYDDARTFVAHLKDEYGAPFVLGSGVTATLEGKNIKGVTFQIPATVGGSDITFTPVEAVTDQPGRLAATLHIENNDENISTLAVMFDVQRAGATKEDIERSPGFTDVIDEAVDKYLDDHQPFFTLPEGGEAGQALLSDGNNGAYWGDVQSGGTGLSDDAKAALLACFRNVAWIGSDGQDYYKDLYDALYPPAPPATLLSISASFNQGSAVIYDTDSLDTLKQYLTVTATYDDSSTGVVTDYTLSGTLAVGTSTITVSYGGKTTTFDVVVTEPAVNYVVVGNPVFDGTWLIPASSNGGFVKTPQVFNPTNNAWVIRTEIETPTSRNGSQDVFGSVDTNNVSVRALLTEIYDGSYYPYLSSNGSAWDISMPSAAGQGIALDNNEKYLLEMYFDGTKYGVRASADDGATWVKDWSKSVTAPIYGQYAVGFGVVRNAVYNGKINLAKTKIYIGGNLWWSAM